MSEREKAMEAANPHLIDGDFQSDKYPTCPRGKVPLSTKDPTAQDLLAEYARRRRPVDAKFSDALEMALLNSGYVASSTTREKALSCARYILANPNLFASKARHVARALLATAAPSVPAGPGERNAALEEAAQIIDDHYWDTTADIGKAHADALAKLIRSLKSKVQSTRG